MSNTALPSHSADIEMWLDCGRFGAAKIKRMNSKSIFLFNSFDAPPMVARLLVFIDNRECVRQVKLVRGLSASRLAVRALSID